MVSKPIVVPELADPPTSVPWLSEARDWRGFVISLLACVLVLLILGRWVDLPLAVQIERWVPDGIDDAFEWIGLLGEANPYLFVALSLYALSLCGLARGWRCPWRGGFERLARCCLLLLAVATAAGLITWLLKHGLARARPEVFFEFGRYGLSAPFSGKPFNSFPSSHALMAFVAAAVLGIGAPRWRWLFWIAAALAAISRVINLDHYLSDVLGSAFLAYAVVRYLKPRILSAHYEWPLRAPWRWWSGRAPG